MTTPLLKFIEVESLDNNWVGKIYIKILRENKLYFYTKQYPFIGINGSNYKDRTNNEVKWSKTTMEYNRMKVKKVYDKVPNVDPLKIYD